MQIDKASVASSLYVYIVHSFYSPVAPLIHAYHPIIQLHLEAH